MTGKLLYTHNSHNSCLFTAALQTTPTKKFIYFIKLCDVYVLPTCFNQQFHSINSIFLFLSKKSIIENDGVKVSLWVTIIFDFYRKTNVILNTQSISPYKYLQHSSAI